MIAGSIAPLLLTIPSIELNMNGLRIASFATDRSPLRSTTCDRLTRKLRGIMKLTVILQRTMSQENSGKERRQVAP